MIKFSDYLKTINELSTELLQRYKDKAKSSAADLSAQGKYKKSTDRLLGHMKATGKQIDKLNKEEVELDEAHKLGDKVIITKGPKDAIGKVGHIGEIRHGQFKGAPKTYTIDHDKGSIQLNSTHFKKHISEDVEQIDEEKVSKHKDLGATKDTKHFVKNTTTGEVISPHRTRADAEEGLRAAEADGEHGHKFKIVRAVHEELISEGAYEKAEENKKSADAAKKQGDMFAHHLHMADHHDNMAEWHGSKGRHGEADRHAQKAEEHHEKAMGLKEGLKPEHNMRPGWMLKADPELAAKVKQNQKIAKARKASYGNPAAGKSFKDHINGK